MVRIPFDGKNLHSNGSNLVRMVRNCIVMLQTSFKRFELALEFLSNGENLHYEWLEWFEYRLNDLNLHSNGWNPF